MRAEPDPDHRLAWIAHDLFNALAVIKGYAQLVQRQVRRGEAADVVLPRLERIDEQVDLATRLVDALRQNPPPGQNGADATSDGRDDRR